MSFQDDIQGQNTQLFPIVVIELGAVGTSEMYYPDYIFLSTNNSSIDIFHRDSIGALPHATRYCKPLLLNIPSIKESVDIESRKFKISNVSLDISNIEYEGKRFTDILSNTSLINVPVSIYFKSPSTTWVSSVDNVFEDYLDTLCPNIYKGIIRRISHDDSKVKIELEDLTEQKAHKDLPQALDQNGVIGVLGDDDSVPDKYKNKPIPMVYGHVDKSPLVVSTKTSFVFSDDDEFASTLDVDSRELYGYVSYQKTVGAKVFKTSPLFISLNDEYINIRKDSSSGDTENFTEVDNNTIQFSASNGSDFALNGEVVTEVLREVSSLSISSVVDEADAGDIPWTLFETGWIQSDDGVNPGEAIYNALDEVDDVDKIKSITTDGDTNTSLEVKGKVSDHGDGYFWIKYHLKDILLDFDCDTYLSLYVDTEAGVNQSFWTYRAGHSVPVINIDSPASTVTIQDLNSYTNEADLTEGTPVGGWDSVSTYNGFSIGIPIHHDYTALSVLEVFTASIQFNEVHLYQLVKIPNLINNAFYANVIGRINTFDDHPELNATYGDDPATTNIVETDYLISGDFIQSPIDIIYDLVRRELGHDAINVDEYTEAKLAHKLPDGTDWRFGFTVSKKTDSKKLIEDIAKSTKCFPKFKNDGTFGFNAIKDTYDVANDYAGATPIKESEVISYSFKKTKPEQIHKKVTVSYNKDYAKDSYLKTTNKGDYDLGADPYYGIESSSDAHLEFESDYIRQKGTAIALASFLSEQYRNDHLLFNLKLPLQYINLEIGDLVKFRDLFNNVKAYGIDYRLIQDIGAINASNGIKQRAFPLFMVISTAKDLDSVSIECIQLHHISGAIHDDWYHGTGAGDTDGDFYFTDSDPIVVSDEDVTPFIVTDPVLSGLEDQNHSGGYSYNITLPAVTAIDGDASQTDTSDSIVMTVLGETVTGGAEYFLGTFNEGSTQILVEYSVEGSMTGRVTSEIITINIDIEAAAPTLSVSPLEGAETSHAVAGTGLFRHIVQLEGNEGVDYFEKYLYNSETAEIGYSATDPNEGDLTDSVGFGTGLTSQNGEPYVMQAFDLFLSATAAFENNPYQGFSRKVYGLIVDNSGLWHQVQWWVDVLPIIPPELSLGDSNSDGTVNLLDVVRTVNYILGNITLGEGAGHYTMDEQEIANIDMNQDGTVDILDIVALAEEILN